MDVSSNGNGGAFAHQRFIDGKKVGFIADDETEREAVNSAVLMIARFCTETGKNPAKIITGVMHK